MITYGWTFLSLHLFLLPRLYFYVFNAVFGDARTLPRATLLIRFISRDDNIPFRYHKQDQSCLSLHSAK